MLLATAGELGGEGCWVILGLRWDVKGDMISMKTNLLSQKQQLTPQPKHANENRERDSVDSLSGRHNKCKATQPQLNVYEALPTDL